MLSRICGKILPLEELAIVIIDSLRVLYRGRPLYDNLGLVAMLGCGKRSRKTQQCPSLSRNPNSRFNGFREPSRYDYRRAHPGIRSHARTGQGRPAICRAEHRSNSLGPSIEVSPFRQRDTAHSGSVSHRPAHRYRSPIAWLGGVGEWRLDCRCGSRWLRSSRHDRQKHHLPTETLGQENRDRSSRKRSLEPH